MTWLNGSFHLEKNEDLKKIDFCVNKIIGSKHDKIVRMYLKTILEISRQKQLLIDPVKTVK
jgi:hypothetical protein